MDVERNVSGKRRRMAAESRREAILSAAGAEFARGGYGSATVADVAERAGASQALVFHYFGSKADLYAEVVRRAIDALAGAQREAIESSGEVSARERTRVSLLVYLDHIADHPDAWAAPLRGGEEPAGVIAMRARVRAGYVEALRELLGVDESWVRHRYAVQGYLGFLDAACLAWVDAGCPEGERHALVEAALGALEGALGDWGS